MKKTFFLGMMLLCTMAAMAQQAVITFVKTDHDFGKINEADGRVSTIFEFKNEGMEPLVLSNVRASCGCTTPKWTREPIEPGQTGTITVTYNPNGRPGKFQKTITVTSNASNATAKLFIRGEVIPKTAKPVNQYTYKMGDLSLKACTMNFGDLLNNANKTQSIEYANLTDHDITVDLLLNNNDSYLTPMVTMTTLKPNETGSFNINLDAARCNDWGPVTYYVYAKVNGKKVLSDEYKITLTANIVEDFSQMTPEQRMKAPIAECAITTLDLGKVHAGGKSLTSKINIKNGGVNPLIIRKVVNKASDCLKVVPSKTNAKGGKSIDLKIEALTTSYGKPLEAGVYRRQIEVITNDPDKSKLRLTVIWTIE